MDRKSFLKSVVAGVLAVPLVAVAKLTGQKVESKYKDLPSIPIKVPTSYTTTNNVTHTYSTGSANIVIRQDTDPCITCYTA